MKNNKYIILIIILFILTDVVLSKQRKDLASILNLVVLVNGLQGLLYENKTFRYINTTASLILFILILVLDHWFNYFAY